MESEVERSDVSTFYPFFYSDFFQLRALPLNYKTAQTHVTLAENVYSLIVKNQYK